MLYVVIFLEQGCKNESFVVVRVIMKKVIKLLIDVLTFYKNMIFFYKRQHVEFFLK
jgi:hypothetical protein